MKFADIKDGTRAVRAFEFPINGATVKLGLRPFTAHETALVITEARKFAEARGDAVGRDGSPLFDLGSMVHTLLLGCVDYDDPAHPPFFESAEQILNSPHLGRDGIRFLADAHELWQEECAPQATKIGTDKLFALCEQIASPDANVSLNAFLSLRPGTLWNFTRFMAALSMNSLTPKLDVGLPSAAN